MTKEEALKELYGFDHCLLTPKGAKKIGDAFGVIPHLTTHTDARSQFKGLTLYGNHKEGDRVKGIEAHVLAMQICDKLGLEYGDYFGRGTQLRSCCEAIRKYISS